MTPQTEKPFRPNRSGMTMTLFIAMSPEERKAWLGSDAHEYDCAAHNEGQACCLEKLIEEEETISTGISMVYEKRVQDRLWVDLRKTAMRFGDEVSDNLDAFYLLACILAYYQAAGRSPETMIGQEMQERIAFILKRAEEQSKPS